MAKFVELVGQSFGRWHVLEKAGRTHDGKTNWLCECTCGTRKTITTTSLKSGNSRSCGCLARELRAERTGVVIECAYCGKSFKISPSRLGKTKYCSIDCLNEAYASKRVNKICERCGKEFEVIAAVAKKGKGKYCSYECKYPEKIKKLCANCGKEYYVTSAHKDSKYCSRKCRILRVKNICKYCQKVFFTRPSETRDFCSNECSASSKKIRMKKICERCGKEFEVTPAAEERGKGRYCSNECKFPEKIEKVCEVCGKRFMVPPSAKERRYCSKKCAGKSYAHSIEYMKAIANERNGKCLSEEYFNAHTPLLWECSEGHTWWAIPDSILRGTWCDRCVRREVSIEDMHRIANERGGKCLSDVYRNMRSKLDWECAHGHRWKATPERISLGRWCRECSAGLGERICRAFFEQLFHSSFPKVYPPWLMGNKGRRLELDGYSEDLNLAFEHQGLQHYKRVKYFHQTRALSEQKTIDEYKDRICSEHGVVLIPVPQIPTLLPIDQVAEYIKSECINKGVPLPSFVENTTVDLTKAYTTTRTMEGLQEMNEIAKSRGGKCLSQVYVNYSTKLLFKCSKGHTWPTTPGSIKAGSWCPRCAGRHKTIEDMRELAESRGGRCLSDAYINAKTKLIWECSEGHAWPALPHSIQRGTWCPTCAKLAGKN
jgi:hypothetical protein